MNNLHFSDDFRQQVLASGRTPKARLLGLSLILSKGSKERTFDTSIKTLSIDDINNLRDLIRSEVEQTSSKPHEVISDQILFLILGALQLENQNASEKNWAMVDLLINDSLKSHAPNRMAWGAFALAMLVILGIGLTQHHEKMNRSQLMTASNSKNPAPSMDIIGPATLSTLVDIRNRMNDGTCQIPQAAMLAIEQRQAFLLFITEGVVDVKNVENLKLALGHVNCLYPQKLMYSPL